MERIKIIKLTGQSLICLKRDSAFVYFWDRTGAKLV
jgi:hypothetical protein